MLQGRSFESQALSCRALASLNAAKVKTPTNPGSELQDKSFSKCGGFQNPHNSALKFSMVRCGHFHGNANKSLRSEQTPTTQL